MRAVPVAIVSILIGAGVGAASAYWSVGFPNSEADIAALRDDVPAAELNFPKFEVDSMTYDFGAMQRGTTKEHAFKVTNNGTKPLVLENLGTTCKCTAFKLPPKPILPGESGDVELTWIAKSLPGQFRQTATLGTSDPRSRRVELTVEGVVTDVSGVEPKEWFFDKLHPGEQRTESVYVMSYNDDDMEILSAELDSDDVGDEFQVDLTKVTKDELPDAKAKSGYRVDVTPNKSLALGPIQQWVVLKTTIEGAEEFSVPIHGTAVGDIEIRGPSAWNDVIGAVHMGDIQSADGAQVRLFLSIKGDHTEGIVFDVAEKDPESLEIELGELKSTRSGAMVPLTVRVPKGLPAAIRNGTGQGEAGRVVLKTNHPLNPEISFGVRYVIKKPGVTR